MTKNALIAVLSAIMWSASAGHAVGAQQPADDPRLDARVTISFQNTAAVDVLVALARAGDLRMILTTTPLLPVTVMLTNVRLRTALDAVCQNAGCAWQARRARQLARNEKAAPEFRDILFLRITALEELVASIPKTVSIDLTNMPVSTVFRVLAAALNVTLVLETELPEVRSNFNLENADTSATLKLLCEFKLGNCAWELNEKSRTLRIFPRK